MAQRHLAHTTIRSAWSRLVAAAVAGLAASVALLPGTSRAAAEFVTPVGTCTKVDTTSDGKDLSVMAGNNVRFEVWGDGIDVNPAVRVTVDDANVDAFVTARITRSHNGAENLMRGCRIAKGSVEVEVDSPAEAGATRQRSLRFRMPLGDESRLQMRVVPFPVPVWTFRSREQAGGPSQYLRQSPPNCLTKSIGTVVTDLNDTRMIITLPPGAGSDTSNCVLEFDTLLMPPRTPTFDIQRQFNYTITAPADVSLSGSTASGGPTATGPLAMKALPFTGNAGLIRRTTATRTSTLRVATPNPNRFDTLTLVINPPPNTNAFTQACNCRNASTGTTINVSDDFQCEIRLSQAPPTSGQLISFVMQDRNCLEAGSGDVNYSRNSGLGTYTARGTGTFHLVPLRALGGTTSVNTACASATSPVSHTLQFWLGPQATPSGPAFTQCQIRIRSPQ